MPRVEKIEASPRCDDGAALRPHFCGELDAVGTTWLVAEKFDDGSGIGVWSGRAGTGFNRIGGVGSSRGGAGFNRTGVHRERCGPTLCEER